MNKKRCKELQEEYKQLKTYMGVIQVANNVSGKIYVTTCSNLKKMVYFIGPA